LTENSFPYFAGGVDTWCRMLVAGQPDADFRVLALTSRTAPRPGARRKSPCPTFLLGEPTGRIDEDLRRAGFDAVGRRREPREREIDQQLVPPLERLVEDALAGAERTPDIEPIVELWLHFQSLDFDRSFASPRLLTAVAAILDRSLPRRGGSPAALARDPAECLAVLRYRLSGLRAPAIEADVLHPVSAGRSALYAMAQRRIHGTPLLLTEHGVHLRESLMRPPPGLGDRALLLHQALESWGVRAVYREADSIATTSSFNRRWEIRLGADPRKILVVPNGVEIERFPLRPPRRTRHPTVVSVGAVLPIKNTLGLIDAMALVREQVPEARAKIFGSVSGDRLYAYRCRRRIEDLGLERSVSLEGHSRHGPSLYADGDVFALSSVSESQPLALIEAMACGLPAVATDVGGVSEAVGDAGILVPPDPPQELAAALTRILSDRRLREDLGSRARARAEQLTHVHVLAAYRRLYRDLLAGVRSLRIGNEAG
jgi:glycosyltransferase involved in cell wall biosynthesis